MNNSINTFFMNRHLKWSLVICPLLLAGCDDGIDNPENVKPAQRGDEVRFAMAELPESRTMYQDDWEAKTKQEIYWGNYISTQQEEINIYCPTNPERGFAKYKINLQATNSPVAESIIKISDIGVQWGDDAVPHTFYAFYPADKASTTLKNNSILRASVESGQSPESYKFRKNTEDATKLSTLDLASYISQEYNSTTNTVSNSEPKTLYGMPDMSSAIMAATNTVPVEDFGKDVALQFNVLADVLDITLNGPIAPNTLGGNQTTENPDGTRAEFIQIQAVTLEVVNPVSDTGVGIDEYEIDTNTPISGYFDLDMSKISRDGTISSGLISNVSGTPFVQLQTAQTTDKSGIYYPTLFVRNEYGTTDVVDPSALDHLRLRAFLIPGQITGATLNKIRVHLQTNCGDFYKMLESDDKFVTGALYPVKFGYFKRRGEDFDLSKWISQLDPNIYISELSIPGAWHAANSNNQGSGVTLEDLYKNGIRAFEVHTKNGNTLFANKDFTEKLNENELPAEDFEKPFPMSTVETSFNYGNDLSGVSASGIGERGPWNVNGTSYNRRREATATVTVTEIETEYYQCIVPKFYLRLFRTHDDTEHISEAIINLTNVMNPTGLLFLEIGMEGETGLTVPYRSRVGHQKTRTQENVQVTGYQYGTSITNWIDVYEWNKPTLTAAWSPSTTIEDNTSGKLNLSGSQAWAIAVSSCLERLSGYNNPKTGKRLLFENTLNENTTIADCKGHVIAKINTNGSENESSYLWGSYTPALFSRWVSGSGSAPMTINLQWGSPVAPDSAPETYLRWCFTELEKVSNVEERKNAIIAMNGIAAKNYLGGLHRTFYESSIGGFLGSNSAENCQALAKSLNPFALSRISNPARQNCPLGLVFMNYAISPEAGSANDSYRSAELIRAIINNNKAFLLNRKGNTKTNNAESK